MAGAGSDQSRPVHIHEQVQSASKEVPSISA